MSLVNPEVIGYLNEYIMRVYINNEETKKVINEMLQQGKFRKYEVTIITKVPYQRRVQLVTGDSTSFITFFDLYTGQINERKAPGNGNNQGIRLGDVDVGRLVMNNVAYKYISLVPINIVGKATVVGVEMYMKAKKGFVEPHMVILDVEQSNVEDAPLDRVFQVLPIEVDADPRKNLRVVLDLFAPQIIGQEHAKKALLLTAVGSGPYVSDDVRFTINGIIIGEASTGKTVLGLELCRSLPRCAFVDASASTEVTLTAAYDSTLKEIVLGPMALLDGDAYDFGVVAINEAQNLKEPELLRSAIEEQRVSVHKGAQHINIRTRVSTVLLMNPTMNSWDVSNFRSNFPKRFDIPFLSRFDYVVVVYPPYSEEEIKEVAGAIRERHRGLRTDYPTLWGIIKYARTINPTEESGVDKYMDEKVVELYNKYKEREIPFLPRTIEALNRLVRAFAKLTLQSKVTRAFVDFVVDNIIDWVNIMSNPALGMIAVGSDKKNAMFLLEKIMKTDCTKETGGCSLADLARKFEEIFNQTPGGEEQLKQLLDKKNLVSINTYVEFLIHNLYENGYIYKCGVDKYCVVNSQ
jgi:DNA replicative helicase MCM subunit Mcm2 (Cdc46/Mcm family)